MMAGIIEFVETFSYAVKLMFSLAFAFPVIVIVYLLLSRRKDRSREDGQQGDADDIFE